MPLIYVEKLNYNKNRISRNQDISFSLNKDQCLLLSGPNGSGKSTLLHSLAGLLRPCQGQIRICGVDPFKTPLIKQQMGVLPEILPLYPELRVYEYLKWVASMRLPKARQASAIEETLNALHLTFYADFLIQYLSRGLKQRVGLAQAIIHKPAVILLDEPTNGLDQMEIQHFKKILQALKKEAAIVISTHVIADVEGLYDQTLYLNRQVVGHDVQPLMA